MREKKPEDLTKVVLHSRSKEGLEGRGVGVRKVGAVGEGRILPGWRKRAESGRRENGLELPRVRGAFALGRHRRPAAGPTLGLAASGRRRGDCTTILYYYCSSS